MSTHTLRALLYSVSAFDTATFALVTVLLGAVALAASYLPAMRATRADPMVVLGHNT
jgi:ABC-type lipoprotein release transport system permease subunit